MSLAQLTLPRKHDATSPEVHPPSGRPSPSATNGPLRLKPSPSSMGRGRLDGGWWPYHRDVAAEAMDLVDHFPEWFDRICRGVYSTRKPLPAAGFGPPRDS
jgi:hypothetical protein